MTSPSDGGVSAFNRAVEQLTTGNLVSPAESLREETLRLVDGFNTNEPVTLDPLAGLIAAHIAQGETRLDDPVLQALSFVAKEVAADEYVAQPNTPQLQEVLHHLGWFTATVALAYGRMELLSRTAQLPVSIGEKPTGHHLFDSVPFRFLQTKSGNSIVTFETFRDWFMNGTLRGLMPFTRRNSDAIAFSSEAELVACLYYTRHRTQVPCALTHRERKAAVGHFNFHFADERARKVLISMFEGTDDTIVHVLNQKYLEVSDPQGFSGLGQLIPARS